MSSIARWPPGSWILTTHNDVPVVAQRTTALGLARWPQVHGAVDPQHAAAAVSFEFILRIS